MIDSDNKHKNWEKSIGPRIEELEDRGFDLEAFYLYSATIEFMLQSTIENQEKWIKHLVSKSKLRFEGITEKKLLEQPLGVLIKIFAQYCDDKQLISKLNEFNSFRKIITHRLLNNPIESLNDKAKQKRLTYYSLIKKLAEYNLFMIQKQIVKNKRKISAREVKKTKSKSS